MTTLRPWGNSRRLDRTKPAVIRLQIGWLLRPSRTASGATNSTSGLPGSTRPQANSRYLSQLGADFTNWAIFEPDDLTSWKRIADATCDHFDTDDADLEKALEILDLELVGA